MQSSVKKVVAAAAPSHERQATSAATGTQQTGILWDSTDPVEHAGSIADGDSVVAQVVPG
jgi:hypothetical protein